jgi:2-polyprenyl-6-methoxyphenol hydroxylase-like FAD-dependent oxidoreductase
LNPSTEEFQLARGPILILGGGISGLTLGIALGRSGIDVEIAEIKQDLRQQAGVGLSLQGNCIAALARIGVANACLEKGMPNSYINMRRPDGALLASQTLIPMGGPEFPGTAGISRNDLHAILLAAAGEAGVKMRMGLSFKSFNSDQSGVEVEFTDGSRNEYDLMVGADGVYSRTRTTLFPQIHPEPCGQAVWRAGVPRPVDIVTTELHLGGPFGVVGICPVSREAAYLYIVEAASPEIRYNDNELAAVLIDKLEPYTSSLVRACVQHLTRSDAISYRHLEWLLVPPPWYRDRVLLIGDAAHCNPPVLAQGAAMGIEDAIVLAELLAQVESVDAALEQFTVRRNPRASLVVRNSVQLCEWEVKHQVSPQEIGRLMMETQVALSAPF